jgi:hypothetical protein
MIRFDFIDWPLESPIQVPKKRLLFIGMHNVMPSVVAICVSNPDRSSLRINRWVAASTPTDFAEIVSVYFPVLYAIGKRRLPGWQRRWSLLLALGRSDYNQHPLCAVVHPFALMKDAWPESPSMQSWEFISPPAASTD